MRKSGINSDLPGLRPIGARALKSAIDTIRPWIEGAEVVDLFSGKGRLGLAALEEGAKSVIFVENNAATLKELSSSFKGDLSRVRFVKSDALRFLLTTASKDQRFDIVFADPPFPLWNEKFTLELQNAVLSVLRPNSIFLVKHPTRVVPSPPIPGLSAWKETLFGESRLLYFRSG